MLQMDTLVHRFVKIMSIPRHQQKKVAFENIGRFWMIFQNFMIRKKKTRTHLNDFKENGF